MAHAELESRLWGHGWVEPDTGRTARFQPHIITPALRELVTEEHIARGPHKTKAGDVVELLTPGDTTDRATYIAQAARRKGMLYARYMRWSHDFGPPGEAVVRVSLADAASHGYSPITLDFGPVSRIGPSTVRGPFDSGAWLVVNDPDRNLPKLHALLIEVKNRRLTLYPRHQEVHQLLHKAATVKQKLAAEDEDVPVVPVLICRRAHPYTFWMAHDLGFHVHETYAQYVTLPKGTEARHFDEVRSELALNDLQVVTATKIPRIVNLFVSTLTKRARVAAARWDAVGSKFVEHYKKLRKDDLEDAERNDRVNLLHDAARDAVAAAGIDDEIRDWALEHDNPDWAD